MKEPKRLLSHGASDFERQLLDSRLMSRTHTLKPARRSRR